ncbi:ABC transporter ATP-binding protein [Erwiniaceae bacterium BAC15a-03b]|uniref:ABC-type dipeptide transporter n=1 Tax=Winslowiella arboricola TaxID=2978220 RepID=A0A9J6PTA1_9GAMM|nr:ABC transporter ATP-binding protein [Winslowiella arboricola]MCU5774362.1 ABC transporter ATP-binding protein [Winslowiella arboricola]MCU5778909.1 ABC transporter ATP-binding protein [Winslowiella arboricola]
MSQPLIDIRNLTIRFGAVTVVKNVDLQIWPGESVALVGESGSGKTLTARSLLGLQPDDAKVTADRFLIAGREMLNVDQRQWRAVRGRSIGYVLQDALISLDPLRRIEQQLADALSAAGIRQPAVLRERSLELLHAAGIADAESRMALYPHQLSGGQRQRALIATALAGSPALLIADEPTTALDMTVQRQILQLLMQRQRDGHALLLISHDLAVVAELADRVLVMRDGEVVEQGATRELLQSPQHAWTQRLLRAVPTPQTRGLRLASAEPTPLAAKVIQREAPLLQAMALNKAYGERQVLNNIHFTLHAGETLGVVGESGSGKTSLVKVVMGLSEPDSGTLLLDGQPWNNLTETVRRPRRARLQLISQDPFSSFDPRYTVEKIIGESLDSVGIFGDARRQRVRQLLDEVQLGDRFLNRYPRELSGGQRQRVAIARAFAPNPALLVADEPVSALDVSVQAQVLDLLADMQAQHGTALLFISHDLGVIQHLADRVLVMQDGKVVESGDISQVFAAPQHPWTQKLLQALPVLPQQVA